jgi:YD repeat-containing protein
MNAAPQELLKEYVQSQHFTSTADIMAAMKEMFRDVIQTVDSHGQMLTETVNGVTYTYTYDTYGNIRSVSDGVNTYAYTYGLFRLWGESPANERTPYFDAAMSNFLTLRLGLGFLPF